MVRKARRVEVQLIYQVTLPTPPPPKALATGVGVHMGLTPRVPTSDGLWVESRVIDRSRLKRLEGRMASIRRKAVASGRARWASLPDGQVRLQWEGGIPSVRYRDFRAQHSREWQPHHRVRPPSLPPLDHCHHPIPETRRGGQRCASPHTSATYPRTGRPRYL